MKNNSYYIRYSVLQELLLETSYNKKNRNRKRKISNKKFLTESIFWTVTGFVANLPIYAPLRKIPGGIYIETGIRTLGIIAMIGSTLKMIRGQLVKANIMLSITTTASSFIGFLFAKDPFADLDSENQEELEKNKENFEEKMDEFAKPVLETKEGKKVAKEFQDLKTKNFYYDIEENYLIQSIISLPLNLIKSILNIFSKIAGELNKALSTFFASLGHSFDVNKAEKGGLLSTLVLIGIILFLFYCAFKVLSGEKFLIFTKNFFSKLIYYIRHPLQALKAIFGIGKKLLSMAFSYVNTSDIEKENDEEIKEKNRSDNNNENVDTSFDDEGEFALWL